MQPTLLDLNRLQDIFGDDKATIKEFVKSFMDSTADLLQQIDKATFDRNTKLLKEHFHRLKGSAGNSGITKLHDLGRQAEDKVNINDWKAIGEIRKNIQEVFLELQSEVEKNFG